MIQTILQDLHAVNDPQLAHHHAGFFKTGPGQYGEGDLFLGIKTPDLQALAKKYKILPLDQIEMLLHDRYHEVRSLGLRILTLQYAHGDLNQRHRIVDLYLKNVSYINNWDLVDISAHKIIGAYVYETGDTSILYTLAKSGHLWSERISVVSCLYLIKKNDFTDIQLLAAFFLKHSHDLMHKAIGWMLREMGKQCPSVLYDFLNQYAATMPRTMLRYAIEKLTPDQRAYYMKQKALLR